MAVVDAPELYTIPIPNPPSRACGKVQCNVQLRCAQQPCVEPRPCPCPVPLRLLTCVKRVAVSCEATINGWPPAPQQYPQHESVARLFAFAADEGARGVNASGPGDEKRGQGARDPYP